VTEPRFAGRGSIQLEICGFRLQPEEIRGGGRRITALSMYILRLKLVGGATGRGVNVGYDSMFKPRFSFQSSFQSNESVAILMLRLNEVL
jgi:hypothetical protein